jgi:WD40 repeat protein
MTKGKVEEMPVSENFERRLDVIKSDGDVRSAYCENLVDLLFGFLIHDRGGLSVDELVSLLLMAQEWDPGEKLALRPRVKRILSLSDPIVTAADGLFALSSEERRLEVEAYYEDNPSAWGVAGIAPGFFDEALADFYLEMPLKMALVSDTGEYEIARNARKVMQLVRHLIRAGRQDALVETLTDVAFVNEKMNANLAAQLRDEYKTAKSLVDKESAGGLRAFAEFFRAHMASMTKYGAIEGIYLQQAYNADGPESVVLSAREAVEKGADGVLLLRRRPAPGLDSEPARTDDADEVLAEGLPPLDEGPRRAGHRGKVRGVCVTPDDAFAVTGGDDGELRVWNLVEAVCESRVPHKGWVNDISVGGDIGKVYTVGTTKELALWDLNGGSKTAGITGHKSWVISSVSLTDNAARAVTAARDESVYLWDLESRELLAELKGHKADICAVAISGDGRRAVSGGYDRKVLLWDVSEGRKLMELDNHGSTVTTVSISRDGRFAITGGEPARQDRGGVAKLFHLETGELMATLRGHTGAIVSAGFTGDDGFIFTASDDGSMRLWRKDGGRCVAAYFAEAPISCCAVGQERMVLGTDNGGVEVVDISVSSAAYLYDAGHIFEERPRVASWHPFSELLAVADALGDVHIFEWHPELTFLERCERLSSGPGPEVLSMGWSVDGSLLGLQRAGGETQVLKVVKSASDSRTPELMPPSEYSYDGQYRCRLFGHEVRVTSSEAGS